MEKFKEFIKNKKDYLFGIVYIIVGELFTLLYLPIFKTYSIYFEDRIIIYIGIYFSFEFFKKGFELFFDKNKRQKKF